MAIQFNQSTDYAKAISDAIRTGASPTYVASLQSQREAKKAASGITGTDKFDTGATNYIQKASYGGGAAYDAPYVDPNDPNSIKPKWEDPLGGGGTGGSGYTPQVDPYQSIRDIFAQRRNSATADINNFYGNQITGYNAQRPQQQQQAQAARGVVDTNYYTKALPEIYAAMEQGGQYRGGQLPEQVIGANTSRTQGLVDIGNTESNNLAAIDEAIRQAEAAKAAKLTQSNADLTVEEEQAILQAQQQAQNNAESIAQLTGTYKDPTTGLSTPTLATQQYNTKQTNDARQQIIDTIGAYSADYQARYNQIANDGDPTNDWQLPYIQQARQEKLAGQSSAAEKKAQQEFENNLKLQQFNLSQQKANKSPVPKEKPPTLSNDQYYNRALSEMNARVPTGQFDKEGKPITRPKYTRQQFENYLAGLPIDDRAYEDIVNALSLDAQDWYAPQNTSQILR